MPPSAAGTNTSQGIASRSSGEIASAPSKSVSLPPCSMNSCSFTVSMPSSLRIAPSALETPMIFTPSCWRIRAAQEPTLPKPCTTTVVVLGDRPSLGAASRYR